jgi:hypothetical protein
MILQHDCDAWLATGASNERTRSNRQWSTIQWITIRLVMAVYQSAGYRSSSSLVSLASLPLHASGEEIDKAVAEARLVGWLVATGEPVHSVRITKSGIEELERHV